MRGLYQSPLRVYLCLACLALWGVLAGMSLSVSLFPNSSKPRIGVSLPLAGYTPESFIRAYGGNLESRLRAVEFDSHKVEKVTADYDTNHVTYTIEYAWGAPAVPALKEVESAVHSFGTQMPQEIRDAISIWTRGDNSGFFALTFYSPTRSLDDLYKYIEPILAPKLAKVVDSSNAGIWNPDKKEIRIELNPEKMALLQLVPSDVSNALMPALDGFGGGSINTGLKTMDVTMTPAVRDLEGIGRIGIHTPTGQTVHLSDIARIDFDSSSGGGEMFKTSGVESLVLFARPRLGGNIKKMSEDILAIVEEVAPTLPKDIQYKIMVDPSEFIRSAVHNVAHEVFLAALLAVVVLFVFIGNFKNVMTAAIEIPMSIILAFILMKWLGINLNLISLGGLALSAGMNVDASVVVMENIFRHFDEHKGPLTKFKRLELVLKAVAEVRFPVIASTVASLVVFLPLAMTSGLTNAILGDLATAVVLSHGLSAFVALILVPTVRLHMMSAPNASTHSQSPIESWLKKLEFTYASALKRFMSSPRLKTGTYGGLVAALVLLLVFVLPSLPKEIIGKPDTDWMIIGVNTEGNATSRQMEGQVAEAEARLSQKFGSHFLYTFTQIYGPNNASIMARMKKKSEMESLWKKLEVEFTSTPSVRHFVDAWNPSEMRLPNPPAVSISVRGNNAKERAAVAREITELLADKKIYPGAWSVPNVERREAVFLRPDAEQWSLLRAQGSRLQLSSIADVSRVATQGRRVGEMPIDDYATDVVIRYPENRVASVEDLAALPIGLNQKVVPLKALAQVGLQEAEPGLYRENGKDLVMVSAQLGKDEKNLTESKLKEAQVAVKEWQETKGKGRGAVVAFEDATKDMNEALHQLGYAVGLSILLIFVTMVMQFGSIVNALLVLVAVPLGFIGVLAALFAFRSTLSLNSVLGVILLNGISVANSIILVDFLKRLVDQGMDPEAAAVEAAQKRVRPILMTSMTTGLGMLPIALGLGEGGRILQPLGIAVIGGLGFSMLMTLFVVPSLQVSYLLRQKRNQRRKGILVFDDEVLSGGADEIPERHLPPMEPRSNEVVH